LIGRVQAVAVDGGGVQESRGSVHLLSGSQFAFPVQDGHRSRVGRAFIFFVSRNASDRVGFRPGATLPFHAQVC
jgi:hypothetical protein